MKGQFFFSATHAKFQKHKIHTILSTVWLHFHSMFETKVPFILASLQAELMGWVYFAWLSSASHIFSFLCLPLPETLFYQVSLPELQASKPSLPTRDRIHHLGSPLSIHQQFSKVKCVLRKKSNTGQLTIGRERKKGGGSTRVFILAILLHETALKEYWQLHLLRWIFKNAWTFYPTLAPAQVGTHGTVGYLYQRAPHCSQELSDPGGPRAVPAWHLTTLVPGVSSGTREAI